MVPLIQLIVETGAEVHLTVVTRTGYAHAQRTLGSDISLSFLPWDLLGFMSKFLNRLQPSLFLLAETEFWPGMLSACAQRNIPVIGINTRISDRSFPRYYATRWLWSRWLAPVTRFLPQSVLDGERLAALGVPKDRIHPVGNLKYAVQPPEVDATALRQQIDPTGQRPILLCASTHDDEESRLLQMLPYWRRIRPDLLLVIVPRHPERFEGVASLLIEHGERMHRWQQGGHDGQSDIILIDAMGKLQSLYAIADMVIIGGSLADIGGHNPLEAAICARGTVMGPHIQNFRSMVTELQQAQAIIVGQNDDDVQAAISRLLQHPDELRSLHAHAALFMNDQGRVLDVMMDEIRPYLPSAKQ